jgi:hypothetical protein
VIIECCINPYSVRESFQYRCINRSNQILAVVGHVDSGAAPKHCLSTIPRRRDHGPLHPDSSENIQTRGLKYPSEPMSVIHRRIYLDRSPVSVLSPSISMRNLSTVMYRAVYRMLGNTRLTPHSESYPSSASLSFGTLRLLPFQNKLSNPTANPTLMNQ